MTYQWALALALHQLGAIIWVGGMFFAHMALRPAAGALRDSPVRLSLLQRVFSRFFLWVWSAILLLWASGLWIFLVMYGGKAGLHVHLMMGIAALMTAIFAVIWFLPYRRMKAAVTAEDWSGAARQMAMIRGLVLANLVLGLVTSVLAVAGPKL
jgi:uncharacterized membrane protein